LQAITPKVADPCNNFFESLVLATISPRFAGTRNLLTGEDLKSASERRGAHVTKTRGDHVSAAEGKALLCGAVSVAASVLDLLLRHPRPRVNSFLSLPTTSLAADRPASLFLTHASSVKISVEQNIFFSDKSIF
jgi:hypothetical protein